MTILALETSTDVGSVAILQDGAILAERVHHAPMKLLSWLSNAIGEILTDTHLDIKKIDALATGIGPGSFTGVRLELATARALAQVRKIPLYGISSLDALAHQALPCRGTILSCLDARRGELFAGIYHAEDSIFTQLGNYLCVSREKLVAEVSKLPGPYRIIGGTKEDHAFFVEHLPDAGFLEPGRAVVLASVVALLADRRRAHSSGDLHSVFPLYFRASQAELEREKKRVERGAGDRSQGTHPENHSGTLPANNS